jgi:hypothetical protein
MGKLRNFFENNVYHPNIGNLGTYALGVLDTTSVFISVNYIRGEGSLLNTIFFVGATMLAHKGMATHERKKESKLEKAS